VIEARYLDQLEEYLAKNGGRSQLDLLGYKCSRDLHSLVLNRMGMTFAQLLKQHPDRFTLDRDDAGPQGRGAVENQHEHRWRLLVHYEQTVGPNRWRILAHYEQTVRPHRWRIPVHYEQTVKPHRWRIPVHYEQTVRPHPLCYDEPNPRVCMSLHPQGKPSRLARSQFEWLFSMTLLPGPLFASLADSAALALALAPAFLAPLNGETTAEEDAARLANRKGPVLMSSRTAQPHDEEEAEAEVEEQQAAGSESANETGVELLFSGTVAPPPSPQPKEKAPESEGQSSWRKDNVAAVRLAWRALGLIR